MSTTQQSVDLFRSSASLYHGSLRSSELQIDLGSKWSPSMAFMGDRLLFGMMVRRQGNLFPTKPRVLVPLLVLVALFNKSCQQSSRFTSTMFLEKTSTQNFWPNYTISPT